MTLLSVPGKAFAQIILDRVRPHLLEHKRPEQSGLTPKRSTIDRILALRVLTERRREIRQGLLAAYVDLCKAFDSVNRDALWRILGLRGVPSKLINLMSELYSGTETAVRCGDNISDLFLVVTGVRQGCVLTPKLFSSCLDWILGRMSERSSCGASFGNVKTFDLDFADDTVIFAETLDILLGALKILNQESEPLGLRVSWVKLRSRLSMTSWMLLSCLYQFVVKMLRSRRDSLTLAVIFMSLLAVYRHLSQASGAMNSLDHRVWRLRYVCRRMNV